MKILKNSKEKNIITLEVEEDFSSVSNAMDKAFKNLSKDVKIPGFRKGKVPRNIFEKYYGKDQILQNASSDVMNDLYPVIITETKIEPIDYPTNVEIVSIEEDKPFVFSLSIPVKPEIKLGKYKGIKIQKVDDSVSDEDIQKEIDTIRDKYAEFVEVTGRESKDEDFVSYDIKAVSGEEEIYQWTKEDSGTKIGTAMISEEFDKEITGIKIGDSKTFKLSFDDDYRMDFAKGKEVEFTVTMKEIREKKLPELDNELAKKVSDFETAEELKSDIKQKMEDFRKKDAQGKMREELMLQIIEKSEADIPEVMINREIDAMLKQFDYSLRNSGLNLEGYVKFSGKTMEDIKADYKDPAEKKVKSDLAIEKISQTEKIEVTNEDILEEAKKAAEQMKTDPQEFAETLSDDYKEYIKSYLSYEKTMQFLLDSAKISK